jgi:uncharacterized membrane protein (DUF106 family)
LIENGQPLLSKKGEKNMMIPIWVYAVVAGIIISAVMAIKTGREERVLELENIEKEGEVYMKRLEQEKEERDPEKVTAT